MTERVVVTREFVAALLAVLSEARNECEASLSPSAQALVPRIAEIEDTAEGVLVDAMPSIPPAFGRGGGE